MYAKHIENENINIEYLTELFAGRGKTEHCNQPVNIFIEQVVNTFQACKKAKQLLDIMRAEHNKISNTKPTAEQIQHAQQNKLKIDAQEIVHRQLESELQLLLSSIPSKLNSDVPKENIIVRQHGEFVSKIKQYEYAGLECQTVFGSKLVVTNSELCRIERALVNWCMYKLRNLGFKEYGVPSIVLEELLYQAGHLPHSNEDVFKTNGYVMSPTGEVGLMAKLSRQNYKGEVRVCTVNQCYRAEAGAHGVDNKGLYRMHEFKKCEMVVIALPERRQAVLDELTKIAYDMIFELGLPVRTVKLSRLDVGAHSCSTYDTESIVNGKPTEVGSSSDCGDGQCIGLNITINGKKALSFNSTAIACSRVMAAIIEHYYIDGKIAIPEVLKPYYF